MSSCDKPRARARLVLDVERVKVLRVQSGVRAGDPSNGPCGNPRTQIEAAPSLDPVPLP
jgi:hypothetical protein